MPNGNDEWSQYKRPAATKDEWDQYKSPSRPSEAEQAASAPGIKPPPNPIPSPQESYVKQITTGKMPLESMQPGLPSPFQHEENANVAQALTLPLMLGEEAATQGLVRVGMRLLGGLAVGTGAQRGVKFMGGGPRTQAIAGVLGALVGGQLSDRLGGIVTSAKITPQEWAKILTSKKKTWELAATLMKKLPSIDKAVAQKEAEAAAAKLEAEETRHYHNLTKAGHRLYKESIAEGKPVDVLEGPAGAKHKAVRAGQQEVSNLAERRVVPRKESPGLVKPPPPPPQEPSLIAMPGSPAPKQPVTYQSAELPDLVDTMRTGRYEEKIEAAREMIRRSKKGLLPPNYKYMLEEAERVAHRNYPPGKIIP